MTASLAVRIRYGNAVAGIPLLDDGKASRIFIRGDQPQNWSGLKAARGYLRVPVHLRQKPTGRFSKRFQTFKNLLRAGIAHVEQSSLMEIASVRKVIGEIRHVMR